MDEKNQINVTNMVNNTVCIILFRCIDKLEEKEQKEREEKQALDTARTATLDCPMCGQKLNTEQVSISILTNL